jgi:hypothetical protein
VTAFAALKLSVYSQAMQSKLIKIIVLFAVILCLPLQGLAAITMPSCQMHGSTMEMFAGHAMDNASIGHADEMSHCMQYDANSDSKKTPCDKCLSCYLSAAQAIIPFDLSVEQGGVAPMFTILITFALNLAPSPLFHPPRPTLA